MDFMSATQEWVIKRGGAFLTVRLGYTLSGRQGGAVVAVRLGWAGPFLDACYAHLRFQPGTLRQESNMTGQRLRYIREGQRSGPEHSAPARGFQLDRTFTDKASGKDTKRPQLDELLRFSRDGDTLFVHSWTASRRTWTTFGSVVQKLTKKVSGSNSSRKTWWPRVRTHPWPI